MENIDKLYQVPDANLSLLQSQIAKLGKRAAKLQVPAPILTIISSQQVALTAIPGEETGIQRFTVMHTIKITGEAPKIAGWTFAAVLQPVVGEDGITPMGNLLRVVPGFDGSIPEKYRAAGNQCDHCHTYRRRNETFVLVSETSEWKQVGRNCLRDFLGHMDPNTYAAWAEILIDAADLAGMAEDDDFLGGSGGRHTDRYMAEDILALGAACIRLYGFRSNKTVREFGGASTSSSVIEWIRGSAANRAAWKFPLVIEDTDKAQAAQVFEWMQALSSRADLSEYFYNLSILGQGATFTEKNFGLAISAISVWAKEQEREINRKKRFEADQNSQFVSSVGARETFKNLTMVYTQDFSSDWGVSTLYKFKTPEGNILVLFTSHKLRLPNMDGIPTGWTGSLVARVKEHEVREGVKQTKITRAKFFEPKLPMATKAMMKTIAWG